MLDAELIPVVGAQSGGNLGVVFEPKVEVRHEEMLWLGKLGHSF